MQKLKVIFKKIKYGWVDIDFYFDGKKVQSFCFSLAIGKFSYITRLMERFLSGKYDQIEIDAKYKISHKFVSEYLDGENPDLELVLEEVPTERPAFNGDGIIYVYNMARFVIGFYSDDKGPVLNEITGSKHEIIRELYFSLMNRLAYSYVHDKSKTARKLHDFSPTQEYNDCKSLLIEKFLYPELIEYYKDKKSGVYEKQRLIRKVKIFKASQISLDEVFKLRNKAPLDVEIFYQLEDSKKLKKAVSSMRMILPSKTLKAQIAAEMKK